MKSGFLILLTIVLLSALVTSGAAVDVATLDELNSAIGEANTGKTVDITLVSDIALGEGEKIIPITSGNVFISGVGVSIYRTVSEVSTTTGMFTVAGGTLSLGTGVTLNGKASEFKTSSQSLIYVSSGNFVLNGGTLIDNIAKNGGGIYLCSPGIVDIRKGRISGCSAKSGGGVYSCGSLTMSSGEISDCSATETAGGGVCVWDKTFEMNGGTITSCKAATNGGGVYVYYDSGSSSQRGYFIMNGGTISGCSAGKGGGVFTYSTFSMKNGRITNCVAKETGGGVNVYSTGMVYLQNNALIKSCKANEGGGIYGKPATNGKLTTIVMSDDSSIVDCSAISKGGGISGKVLLNDNAGITGCTVSDPRLFGECIYGEAILNGASRISGTICIVGTIEATRNYAGCLWQNGDNIYGFLSSSWRYTFSKSESNPTVLTPTYKTNDDVYDGGLIYYEVNGDVKTPDPSIISRDPSGRVNLAGALPELTKRKDYVFNGWYSAPKNGVRVSTATEATEASDSDVTLYAIWTKRSYDPSDYGLDKKYYNYDEYLQIATNGGLITFDSSPYVRGVRLPDGTSGEVVLHVGSQTPVPWGMNTFYLCELTVNKYPLGNNSIVYFEIPISEINREGYTVHDVALYYYNTPRGNWESTSTTCTIDGNIAKYEAKINMYDKSYGFYEDKKYIETGRTNLGVVAVTFKNGATSTVTNPNEIKLKYNDTTQESSPQNSDISQIIAENDMPPQRESTGATSPVPLFGIIAGCLVIFGIYRHK